MTEIKVGTIVRLKGNRPDAPVMTVENVEKAEYYGVLYNGRICECVWHNVNGMLEKYNFKEEMLVIIE